MDVLKRERLQIALLGLGAFVLYALSAPSVVNGDGLGYLRPLRWNAQAPPVPGHLLYLPLLRLLRFLSADHLLELARLANAAAGAAGVLLCRDAFRRITGNARAAFLGAAGLAVSYGWWIQAADVETYAFAALAVAGTLLALARWQERPTLARALAAGACAALATLFHVTNLLLLPAVGVWLATALASGAPARRVRLGHAAAAVALAVFAVVDAYVLAAVAVLHKSPAQAWAWFRGAGHGFTVSIRPYNLTDAVHGLGRSLVHAPYVHEADISVTLGQYLFGLAALGIALGVPIVRRHALGPVPGRALLAWLVPYALVAILFFPTDPERWIFLLPALWLLFAAGVASLPEPPRLARALPVCLFAVNAVTAILPGVTDITPRWQARAVEAQVDAGDLVVFPGHDWDEYIGFYDRRNIRVWPMAFYVGAHGKEHALELLEDSIRWARNRGGQVYVVRVLDGRPERRGWDELGLLGFPKAEAAAWFTEHFDVTALDPVRGVELHRLEDTPRAPPRARKGYQKTETPPPASSGNL